MRWHLLLLLAFVPSLHGQTLVNSYRFGGTLNNGLISYWKLDETSGTRIDSEPTGTAQDLTDNNTVGNTAGKIGNAALFIEVNTEYLSRVDSADLSVGNIDFTIVGWFKFTSAATDMAIVSQWSPTGNQRSWRFFYNSAIGKMSFEVSTAGTATDGTATATLPNPPLTGTWYFFVVWHDATANTINVQLNNGTVYSAAYTLGVFDSSTTFDIGARGAGVNALDGAVDEVGFWKRVLTAAEVTALYNSVAGRTCCPF